MLSHDDDDDDDDDDKDGVEQSTDGYCLATRWQICTEMKASVRYDTIRYGRFTCAEKLTRWPA